MGLRDLFKSPQERRREERRRRRRAFRDSERVVDSIKDRIDELKKERKKAWEDAKKSLMSGDKFNARTALQQVRHYEILSAKLLQKYLVSKAMLVELQNAGADIEFNAAFGALSKILKIDVDKTEDVLEDVKDILQETKDSEKIWSKTLEEIGKEEGEIMGLEVPSLEELEKQLQEEVAEIIPTEGGLKESNVEQEIESAEKRLKKLLEEEE